jgi:hypothetical protein
MSIDLSSINWLAVLASGLVAFFIGGAWYTALFGEIWKKHSKYTDEQMTAAQQARPMPVFFGMMVVAYIVIAFFVALLVQATGPKTVFDGVKLGLILWLLTAGVSFTHHISSIKGWGAYYVDVGYQLVYLVLMSVILTAWK